MTTRLSRGLPLLALAVVFVAIAQTNTNSPVASDTPTQRVTTVVISATTNVSAAPHRGIGGSRLGASIGSYGGGSVEFERTVTYTVVTGPTNTPATNAPAK